jgi:hypothetical protein
MANRLKKLAINFVSLVDRPANQPAEIVLTKRDDTPDSATTQDTSAAQESTVTDKDKSTDQPTALTKADLDAAVAAAVDAAVTAAVKKASDENSEKITKLETDLKSATERATQAEIVAKAEQDARATTEAIAKAQRDYPHLPGTTAPEIAPILRKCQAALTEDEYKKLDEVLKAASVAVGKSPLFQEHGSANGSSATGSSGDSAYGQIEKIAKDYRDKEPSMSVPQSIDKAMQARPDLVVAYREEQGFVAARNN